MILSLVIIFTSAALVVIAGITLSNVFFFPRLKSANWKNADRPPLVSVMIPARNEALVISQTIRHLLAQDYQNFEILLLDDHSLDRTGEIAHDTGKNDSRLTVMQGKPLPSGWIGKNWACQQLAGAACGDILLFTDADVLWQESALTALVAEIQRTDADLYTIWPTQTTQSWAERLVVPLMAVVVIGYLPVIGTHFTPLSVFAAANGQCMAWRRDAYDIVGGHVAVYDNVLEDVTLARIVKKRGLKLRMADGNRLIGCRMYRDWSSVRDGYAKNILAGYGGHISLLLLATLFHWIIFLGPWIWLIFGWAIPSSIGWPLSPILLILLGLLIRALSATFTRQRVLDAVFMPISVLLMTVIASQSMYWHLRFGGPKWKGRIISKKPTAVIEL
ncbi:MAG: glycosyltransferase [Chitinophagaceae bacterium]|nr:glycosyltransferase [Anaerolineae bacterium]